MEITTWSTFNSLEVAGDVGSTDSTQGPPLHKGHLYTRTTSTQGPPLHKDHLYTRATSTQGPPLHKDHLYTRATSTQGPPLHKDHLYTRTTSTQGPPLHKGHLYTRTTSTQGPPLHKGHLYINNVITLDMNGPVYQKLHNQNSSQRGHKCHEWLPMQPKLIGVRALGKYCTCNSNSSYKVSSHKWGRNGIVQLSPEVRTCMYVHVCRR